MLPPDPTNKAEWKRWLVRETTSRLAQLCDAYPAIPSYHGQRGDNRFAWVGNSYFEFGDVRFDLGSTYLVIELEGGGGVTNLVKYWYLLTHWAEVAQHHIRKPITLLHVYVQGTGDDYRAHLNLWLYLWGQMAPALGTAMSAKCRTLRSVQDMDEVAHEIEQYLLRGAQGNQSMP